MVKPSGRLYCTDSPGGRSLDSNSSTARSTRFHTAQPSWSPIFNMASARFCWPLGVRLARWEGVRDHGRGLGPGQVLSFKQRSCQHFHAVPDWRPRKEFPGAFVDLVPDVCRVFLGLVGQPFYDVFDGLPVGSRLIGMEVVQGHRSFGDLAGGGDPDFGLSIGQVRGQLG